MNRREIHHIIYFVLLLFMVVAIPTSNYMMSMAGIFLSANWIAEWNWKEKWQRLKENKLVFALGCFFFLFLFALLPTDHLSLGFDNALSKLPLLYAPLILATEDELSGRELRWVLNIFIACVTVVTFLSISFLFFNDVQDYRELSLFISHIRFSFSILLSVLFCLLFAFTGRCYNLYVRAVYALIALWLIAYMFVAQTVTGICILVFSLFVFIVYLLFAKKQIVGRKWFLAFVFVALSGCLGYVGWVTADYFSYDDSRVLDEVTARGNPYTHDAASMVENGSPIDIYLCESELQTAWQEHSLVPYQDVKPTLVRYLNSKGLRKDAEGVEQLSERDFDNIENGIANVAYTEMIGIRRALYPTFFSWSLYRRTGMTANSSLLQRVELWRASSAVFVRHFWTGVGAGDHKQALDEELAARGSELRHGMGCHNQFLTFGVMGGVFLLLAFAGLLIVPFCFKGNNLTIYYVLFVLLVFLSCLTEDTLETQAGITFYAFFNAFFLFCFDMKKIFNHHNL